MSQTPATPQMTPSKTCVDTQALEGALQVLPSELFVEVVEQSSVAISITDPESRILYCNQALSEITGYRRSELIGQKHSLLASQQTPRSRYQEMWNQLLALRPWSGRLINRRKDGTVYLAEVTVTPVVGLDGQLTHYLGMHRDISASFALEQRVHNQMALIEAVLNAAPSAVVVLDENLNVVLDNLAYKTLRTDLKRVEPYKALGYPEVGCSLPGQEERFLPLTIRGQIRWFSLICQPLLELNEEAGNYFGEGKRPSTLLLMEDVTERRRQMEQTRLEVLRSDMESQKTLALIRETLEAALVQLGAPLNMLEAAQRLDPTAAGNGAMVMQVALQEGKQAIARLEACRPALQDEPFQSIQVNDLLHDLQDLYLPRLTGNNRHLKFVEAAAGTSAPIQRICLLSALSLLLERSLLVTATLPEATIRVSAESHDQELCLVVEDNATVPIPSAHRLFQPFHVTPQGDAPRIELSLVQSIVNTHKGIIEVGESPLGGCRISLRIPSQLGDRRFS